MADTNCVPTLDDEIKEQKRELDQKRRAYPKWVIAGAYGLTEEISAHRIACCEATLNRLIHLKSLEPKTFAEQAQQLGVNFRGSVRGSEVTTTVIYPDSDEGGKREWYVSHSWNGKDYFDSGEVYQTFTEANIAANEKFRNIKDDEAMHLLTNNGSYYSDNLGNPLYVRVTWNYKH